MALTCPVEEPSTASFPDSCTAKSRAIDPRGSDLRCVQLLVVSIIPEAAVTVIAILAARGNRMGQRLVVFVLELTD